MRRLRAFFVRLGILFQKERRERDLAEELESTLHMHIDDNLRSGMSPEEARYAALRSFGGVEQTKEECRDVRGLAFLETFLQDLRYGIRLLLKSPGFTAVAVLSLALGIGANTAIFSIINAVLLRPLPFEDPDRLVLIWHKWKMIDLSWGAVSAPSFIIYRDQASSFERVAVVKNWSANLTGQGESERITGFLVSSSFFPTLGVQPALGRTFLQEEDQPGANQVVVLNDNIWKRRFGSDPNLIGKKIMLDGSSYSVIGIMPQSFDFPRENEMWAPIAFTPEELSDSNHSYENFMTIARLREDVSLQEAQAEMNTIAGRVQQQYPRAYPKESEWGIGVSSVRELLIGNVRPTLLLLFGAVGLVLLIGCANVANLLLARATARQKEIAVRLALGANRWRLMRQLLSESMILGLLSGALGLLIAFWVVGVIPKAIPSDVAWFLPNWNEVSIDNRVLGFTLGISLLTALIFGLVPGIQASRLDINESLKEGGRRGTSSVSSNRIRGILVISEVALALVLMTVAGLLIRSFSSLQALDPGLRTQNVLTMQLSLTKNKYANNRQTSSFYDRVLQQMASVPGVESAGIVSWLPLIFGDSMGSFFIEGRPQEPGENNPHGSIRIASPGYFRAMGITLKIGRDFLERDTADATPVIIIDEMVAQSYWPNEDSIGKRVAVSREGGRSNRLWRHVIGVVGHVRHQGLDVESKMQMYIPSLQFQVPRIDQRTMYLVVRTTSDPMSMFPAVRSAIHAVDADQPVTKVATMEQVLSGSLSQRRLPMLVIAALAVLALVLTIVGIYGIVSYSVGQRNHEIGIRMALGASRGNVTALIVKQGLQLALIGVGIGLVAAFSLTRFIASLLYGVSATDLATFASVPLLLVGITALASYLPARRAARVDPMLALRTE